MTKDPKPYGDEHLSRIAGNQDQYLVTINDEQEDEHGEEKNNQATNN